MTGIHSNSKKQNPQKNTRAIHTRRDRRETFDTKNTKRHICFTLFNGLKI